MLLRSDNIHGISKSIPFNVRKTRRETHLVLLLLLLCFASFPFLSEWDEHMSSQSRVDGVCSTPHLLGLFIFPLFLLPVLVSPSPIFRVI